MAFCPVDGNAIEGVIVPQSLPRKRAGAMISKCGAFIAQSKALPQSSFGGMFVLRIP
jgi:hypothetical protein